VTSDRIQFLTAANRIGSRLCRDALWSDGKCNWLGWGMQFRSGQWNPTWHAMGSQLYDGTAGIGLFLAFLSRHRGGPIIRTTATGALAQALTAVDSLVGAGEYGFCSGLSGIARSCAIGGALLENEELVDRGATALMRAARIAPHANRLDVINGSAGLIPVLIEAADRTGSGELLQAAIAHGEHLLAHAARSDEGWSWDTMAGGTERNLVGYSHGTSGIACALAELARVNGRADFLSAAREALRYERSHFRPAAGNWPDFRSFEGALPGGEPPCMLAWCHGAPGIGFARLRIWQLLPEEEGILSEAETAIQTTLRQLTSAGLGNFSLCHGDGGNADMLLLAADLLDRPELRQHVEATAMAALDRFDAPGLPWPCGVLNAGETPNLFLGLAGIGYFFLRLYDSENIPTVLLPAYAVNGDIPGRV
jgi:type 2 lantibiotic biosynthesis protein LanM